MKKNIPLALLEALQPVTDNNLDLIKAVKNSDVMFHLIDKDEKSDFYFKVVKQEIQNGRLKYLIEYKPHSRENVKENSSWLELETVKSFLKTWLELINGYNKIQTVYDDPITINNQQRFEKQFKILDPEAEYVSFDLPQQLYLEKYLLWVQSRIVSLKEGKSENEIKELEEIEEDAQKIYSVISKESKTKILKRLTWLWAKAQKEGPYLIKEFLLNMTIELGKKLLINGM